MAIDAEILRQLSEIKMPAEAFRQVMTVLANFGAKEEARKQKDRDRKRAGKSTETALENPRKIHGNGAGKSEQSAAEDPSPEVPPKNNIKPLPTPISSSLRSETSRAEAGSIFDAEFWPAYPRRDGSNPKETAKTKFVQHVAKGVDPAEIVAGAKAYAAFVANDDPRFTAQAVTWLNQRRWRDEYGERAQAPPKPKRETFEDAANWFLKGTTDGDRSRGEESPPDALELSPDEWSRA